MLNYMNYFKTYQEILFIRNRIEDCNIALYAVTDAHFGI